MRMKLFVLLMLIPSLGFSSGFHYCSGKVTAIVTRATSEQSYIRIEGLNGWVKLGYGGEQQVEMQNRQFSMLLAAYMSGKKVRLEFLDNSLKCSDFHKHNLIRFVHLSN